MEDMLASSVARCGLYSSPILHQGQAMQPKLALKSLPGLGAFASPPLFASRGSGSAFSLPMVNGGEQQRLAGWTGMGSASPGRGSLREELQAMRTRQGLV
ncbi:hypothetical protein GUITHDRAFT_152631 [Guillardia theta CCMP2712]|uniref:Uncharacterized protein n=2 Tax=Guillardia theta TaxID=55529 RepID=L1JB55_GUITC|nr:hypothetical protein GUITHDRAFT_152631 [Guillardia theta CCMP2712]EKX45557.1 hypothetical protein GUITHDRAFT_152631 [Guillardia theta CCMP2712]|eukprot:XP_005832537.1 hypothetical protein GUITHDRAFT_152631 [Guillardia theta CCMP2712]